MLKNAFSNQPYMRVCTTCNSGFHHDPARPGNAKKSVHGFPSFGGRSKMRSGAFWTAGHGPNPGCRSPGYGDMGVSGWQQKVSGPLGSTRQGVFHIRTWLMDHITKPSTSPQPQEPTQQHVRYDLKEQTGVPDQFNGAFLETRAHLQAPSDDPFQRWTNVWRTRTMCCFKAPKTQLSTS